MGLRRAAEVLRQVELEVELKVRISVTQPSSERRYRGHDGFMNHVAIALFLPIDPEFMKLACNLLVTVLS